MLDATWFLELIRSW